jgi:hypothetical protein
MIQNSKLSTVREAAILTTSYVTGTTIDTEGIRNQLILLVDFTIGSLTDAQIKLEFSRDGSTWYQETFSSISTGTDTLSLGVHKMTATGLYRVSASIMDRYVRVSAIGTGTATSSSLAIFSCVGES